MGDIKLTVRTVLVKPSTTTTIIIIIIVCITILKAILNSYSYTIFINTTVINP
ncbi:predicted protein [Plenodomus lingam JN3]|uniref:Predicted protein n=1 Tax=Leptosphaeria maculans (strain JN3 / isolate v23.1.3 / race Av1-4-5-6-7-8) TaxID=985895 RepID=E4ZTV6_LEPMJ|nr:predicted protein [Plenodomus lingam JN3]CBX94666.1 predicted protein [Plenodomus lingam JN3]